MFTKRRIRFSIGAMLVVMAAVAVLLNREVQRAKAIETTVKRIKEWNGQLHFRPRAPTPNFLANILPEYWLTEIDSLNVDTYFDEDTRKLEEWLELGALKNLRVAALKGHATNYDLVSRLCKSTSIEQCYLFGVSLSNDEIANLSQSFPKCQFRIVQHHGTHSSLR